MTLVQRTITSTGWNVSTNLVRTVVLFARSVLLMRLLPVETFGIYALASAWVALTLTVTEFGMGGAFLHRSPESRDEGQAATIHFTLTLGFVLVWALSMIGAAFLLAGGAVRTALLALVAVRGVTQLARTPELILIRRVQHRRLAILNLIDAVLTTVAALLLAWRGSTLWALLATDLVTMGLTILMLYLWRPIWRPRIAWERSTIRYFLGFGGRSFVAAILARGLDRIDDIWTGTFLNAVSLGFYSRAYTFATYPRQILATPITTVAGGTYAELQGNRTGLSKAFFRTNALLVRSGFFLAGLLALIAPEFIRLFLGARWLPMLDAFRFMLIFTLLDPLKGNIGNLFVTMGKPEQVVRVRLVQLLVMAGALFLLGPRYDITGVALAANSMLLVGIAIMLWQAGTYVDFSSRRLFAAPGLALVTGLLLTWGGRTFVDIPLADWQSAILKIILFVTLYGSILLLMERRQVIGLYAMLIKPLRRTTGGPFSAGED